MRQRTNAAREARRRQSKDAAALIRYIQRTAVRPTAQASKLRRIPQLLSPLLSGQFGPELAKYASANSPLHLHLAKCQRNCVSFFLSRLQISLLPLFPSRLSAQRIARKSALRNSSEPILLRRRSASCSRPDGRCFGLQQLCEPVVGLRFRQWTYTQSRHFK